MNPKFLFEQFPKAEECFVAGNEAFLQEKEAEAFASEFNRSYKKVLRDEVINEPSGHTITIVKAEMVEGDTSTDTTLGEAIAAKLSAKDKAKVEAIAKAEAEAKAQAEVEAKAQTDAPAEAEAASNAPAAIVDAP